MAHGRGWSYSRTYDWGMTKLRNYANPSMIPWISLGSRGRTGEVERELSWTRMCCETADGPQTNRPTREG